MEMMLPALLHVILALLFVLNLFSAVIAEVCHAVVHIDNSCLKVCIDSNLELARLLL